MLCTCSTTLSNSSKILNTQNKLAIWGFCTNISMQLNVVVHLGDSKTMLLTQTMNTRFVIKNATFKQLYRGKSRLISSILPSRRWGGVTEPASISFYFFLSLLKGHSFWITQMHKEGDHILRCSFNWRKQYTYCYIK